MPTGNSLLQNGGGEGEVYLCQLLSKLLNQLAYYKSFSWVLHQLKSTRAASAQMTLCLNLLRWGNSSEHPCRSVSSVGALMPLSLLHTILVLDFQHLHQQKEAHWNFRKSVVVIWSPVHEKFSHVILNIKSDCNKLQPLVSIKRKVPFK